MQFPLRRGGRELDPRTPRILNRRQPRKRHDAVYGVVVRQGGDGDFVFVQRTPIPTGQKPRRNQVLWICRLIRIKRYSFRLPLGLVQLEEDETSSKDGTTVGGVWRPTGRSVYPSQESFRRPSQLRVVNRAHLAGRVHDDPEHDVADEHDDAGLLGQGVEGIPILSCMSKIGFDRPPQIDDTPDVSRRVGDAGDEGDPLRSHGRC